MKKHKRHKTYIKLFPISLMFQCKNVHQVIAKSEFINFSAFQPTMRDGWVLYEDDSKFCPCFSHEMHSHCWCYCSMSKSGGCRSSTLFH